MGKHELKKEKEETKWSGALAVAYTLLLGLFAMSFCPLLHKGSLAYLDKTSNLFAVVVLLPLVLCPWRKAPAPLALIHDLLLLGSASAVSVVVVEYMVKGGSVGLEQSFWQGWLCYIGLYAIAYLITARGRLAVCVGMGISLLHGLIDHYVMLFRGTPVMLSDVFSIGTAANVAQGYSAPVELSVLRGADRLPRRAVRSDFRPEKADSAVVSAVKNATVCVRRNGCFSTKRKASIFLITV